MLLVASLGQISAHSPGIGFDVYPPWKLTAKKNLKQAETAPEGNEAALPTSNHQFLGALAVRFRESLSFFSGLRVMGSIMILSWRLWKSSLDLVFAQFFRATKIGGRCTMIYAWKLNETKSDAVGYSKKPPSWQVEKVTW